ncbi:cadherin repeat domain-containing protein [Maribacter algicola]|uniref:Cadherin repeat domain-containing protein n=1 Tax=Meishania litoralis TaxID=3434685 RepID=A0ACC7LFX1_9FLAO
MIKQILNVKIFLALVLLMTIGCNKDDDQPSTVSLQNLEVSLDENPSNGAVVGTIQTVGGSGTNFSITSQSPSGALSIDSDTGELTVANATVFDFETNPTITATITSDNAENSVTVTITLNNTNEVTAQNLEVTIDENPTNGEVIGSLQTMGNASGFTITTQSPVGAMDIDSNSGELTVADASLFDFETNPTLTATVSIADAANPVSVTVNLNDVLEITVQDFTAAVDENPIDGQVLGTVQATGNGTLSYSVISQTPMGAMAIDAATGELTVIDPNLFDFEVNPVITADISVTDGVETTAVTATINLIDVDEVSATNTDLTIDENPSNGDVVGALQASGSNLTYTITFQNPAGAFAINQSTGELSVADEILFDFETNPNMLATISVSNGTQTVSANAFVELNDLNEIGEYKFGGVIFWIDPASNNSEGLVCATTNLNVNAWGCSGILTGASGTGIGTGETNSTAIISAGCIYSAAESISLLDWNGYNDWFLPSVDEFNEIAINYYDYIWPTIQANGGSALLGTVWTSTEVDANQAYIAFLGSTTAPIPIPKNTSNFPVLPIRSFTDF